MKRFGILVKFEKEAWGFDFQTPRLLTYLTKKGKTRKNLTFGSIDNPVSMQNEGYKVIMKRGNAYPEIIKLHD